MNETRETRLARISVMPLVAILRGITPNKAAVISDILVEAGFRFLEVTLNSPDWQHSMEKIRHRHNDAIVVGAGTVLSVAEVDQVHAAGGQAIISPRVQVEVIQRTNAHGMLSIPGCYSPTECFTALDAGADILKIFPAETLGRPFLQAIAAVLPPDTRLCPTGGITADNLAAFMATGVFALGIGSALYAPTKTTTEIAQAAAALVAAYHRHL